MEAVPAGGDLSVVDYLRPVWRFKFVVVLVAALAAAATYVYTNHEAKVYQTSTQIYVGQSRLQQLLNPAAIAGSDRTVADQAQLLATPSVADVVRTRLKLPYSPQALLGAIQVVPDPSTDFLTITAQSTNPQLAARLANGFAQAYLQVSSAHLVQSAQATLQSVQNTLQHLGGGSANDAARQALRQQIGMLEGVVVDPPSVGEQLTPAPVPGAPVSPNPKRNAIFAGVLALVIGVIAAYLFDRSDRRVRRLGELEALFDVPVLATVPHVRRAGPTREDPHGTPPALREPYRTLRVNLDIARAARDAKVIMVSSALSSEGKSTIVRNLAVSYREAGARVAVVEADLRRPVLAARFGVDQQPGLGEVLAHGGELQMQRAPDASRLNGAGGVVDVAVAGAAPDNPTALLTEGRVRSLMERLGSQYDIVLVDSPPLLAVSDGLPLLGLVDGVLLVVRAGTATRSAAIRLRRTIDRVSRIHRVYLLGAVANDVADEDASYYRLDGKGEGATPVTRVPGPAAS